MTCPICLSDLVHHTLNIPDHEYGLPYKANYTLCKTCGCYYQSPMPDDKQLVSFYPDEYHSMHQNNLVAMLKNYLRMRKISPYLENGKVFLDFGCGDGTFIKFAAEANKIATFYGYEINSTDSISKYNGNRCIIIRGSIKFLLDNLPECSIISLHHVIEHLPDPKETIKLLCSKLASGGVITGQTPACDSMEMRIFKTRWSGFHAPRHTVVFSRNALKQVFDHSIFSNVSIKSGFNPAGIAISLASLFDHNEGGIIKRNGFKWIFFVLSAVLLSPLDFLSGSGIIDFYAYKNSD